MVHGAKREGSAPLNPLDIDTMEQAQKANDYHAVSVTPKEREDLQKAKVMEQLINHYMKENKGKLQAAMQAALLDGFNLDPTKYLRQATKKGINIPIDEIRVALANNKYGKGG